MESSIPENLRCPRSQPRRVDDNYTPPYPAWVARSSGQVRRVVMAYFGVQWRGADSKPVADKEFAQIVTHLGMADGPVHFDSAREVDSAGFQNRLAIAYWLDPDSFERWRNCVAVAQWWLSRDQVNTGVGYFREIFSPRLERFETLFSNPDHLEGVGVALGRRSTEDISEHAYWGSMRERLPLSQTDPLHSTGLPHVESTSARGRRTRISGHENLAIIRSGQEWTETEGKERALYAEDIEPILRQGMEFLRDQGISIGCYVNRYVRHIDQHGEPLEKTFGFSMWKSLAHLEKWAEAHPTHIAIFGTFMRVVQTLEFNLKLRLYHEVAVLARDEQEYEYIDCHAATGMLVTLGQTQGSAAAAQTSR